MSTHRITVDQGNARGCEKIAPSKAVLTKDCLIKGREGRNKDMQASSHLFRTSELQGWVSTSDKALFRTLLLRPTKKPHAQEHSVASCGPVETTATAQHVCPKHVCCMWQPTAHTQHNKVPLQRGAAATTDYPVTLKSHPNLKLRPHKL